MDVQVVHNVISHDEIVILNSRFSTLEYRVERDFDDEQPNGLSSKLPMDIVEFLHNKVTNFISLDEYFLQRCYVNLIRNTDVFVFHPDTIVKEAITILFYVNTEYDIRHYGETIFIDGEESKVVFPEPGKMVIFDAKILHTARSFNRLRDDPRFTIAMKYIKNV